MGCERRCRFLREHARKTQEEGRIFLKTMRQEAKANEDRHEPNGSKPRRNIEQRSLLTERRGVKVHGRLYRVYDISSRQRESSVQLRRDYDRVKSLSIFFFCRTFLFVAPACLLSATEARSQMESIQRATQWSRELGTGVVYLPHYSMCGKLGVLKMEKGETVPEKGKTEGYSPVREEGCCKVISVESFLKTDFVK